jgi:hypothetical protein
MRDSPLFRSLLSFVGSCGRAPRGGHSFEQWQRISTHANATYVAQSCEQGPSRTHATAGPIATHHLGGAVHEEPRIAA